MTDAMHPDDPFLALRRPDAPIAPSASFAAQLRQRLVDELGVAPSAHVTPPARKDTTMTVTPYLIARDAAAAIDFYRDAFGAEEIHRLVGDDGRVGHAEIMIGGSKLMLADEYPEVDAMGPQTRGGPTCSFHIEVDDVDAAYRVALTAGGTSLREPADQFHGSRSATIQDPFGHRWTVSHLIEDLSIDEYAERAENSPHGSFTLEVAEAASTTHHQAKHHDQGDLYYFTLPVRDLARAKQFFGAVLGWQFGTGQQGHIENISAPPGGLNDSTTDTGARLWFVVDDIHAAVARVRELGGTAQDPIDYPSGMSSDCTDDQGTEFSLSVPSPEYTA